MVLLIGAMLLVACDGTVYDTYRHTPTAGWEKNDTLFYDIPPVRSAADYELQLGIRTNNAFPFVAVTLIIDQTVLPSGQTMSDTLDCHLTKENSTQKPNGISYSQYTTVVRRLRLAAKDSLHITVRHDMKRDILPGVSDVGIALSTR